MGIRHTIEALKLLSYNLILACDVSLKITKNGAIILRANTDFNGKNISQEQVIGYTNKALVDIKPIILDFCKKFNKMISNERLNLP